MQAFIHFLIFVSASIIVVQASVLKNCLEDEECGKNMFCFPDTGFCTRCLACQNYMRMNPADICVKEPKDCGDCVDGYEEEKLTTGQFRELCTAARIQPPLANTTAPSSSLQWIVGVGVSALVVVGLVFAISIWVWKPTIKARARAEFQSEPSNTSSYCDFAPSAPPPSYETVATEERSFERRRYESKETQNLLQATPFNSPQWVSNSPDDEEAAVDTVDGAEQMDHQSNGPDIHDEETIPSNWSPGLGYGNQQDADASSEITSNFAGLFNGPSATLTSPASQPHSVSGDGVATANHSASSSRQEEPSQNSGHSPHQLIVINITAGNTASVLNQFGNS